MIVLQNHCRTIRLVTLTARTASGKKPATVTLSGPTASASATCGIATMEPTPRSRRSIVPMSPSRTGQAVVMLKHSATGMTKKLIRSQTAGVRQTGCCGIATSLRTSTFRLTTSVQKSLLRMGQRVIQTEPSASGSPTQKKDLPSAFATMHGSALTGSGLTSISFQNMTVAKHPLRMERPVIKVEPSATGMTTRRTLTVFAPTSSVLRRGSVTSGTMI
mmetsp:Transcript_9679/g.14253  ORF Transcript_9679/g.14253 Transcript_9679/m.14253 type:complete len:218 (+) Transcript_9679:604-1257(+)